ncbi:MAG: signal peptidase I [Microbacterium sp.]|nr:MAG: signal peptidase I [Microbacterium sp.]
MPSKIAAVAGWLVIAAIVAGAVVMVMPRLMGGATLTILTGSMQPTLNPGDVIAVTPVADADLRVGDVVTFQPVSGDPTLVTHRVVDIDSSGVEPVFTTRGDANSADDEPIISDQIQGRVLYTVPLLGWARTLLGPAVPVIVAVVAGCLIAFGTVAVLRPSRPRSSRKAST